jgi:hypothetical protein
MRRAIGEYKGTSIVVTLVNGTTCLRVADEAFFTIHDPERAFERLVEIWTLDEVTRACYVCRRYISEDDRPLTLVPDPEPDDVSHGACSECQPLEWARMEKELDAIQGR